MPLKPERLSQRLLGKWVRLVTQYPWLFLLLTLLSCIVSLSYTAEHLTMNTDTSQMLSQDLPFQKSRVRYEKAFPQDVGSVLVLVEASTSEQTTAAVKALGQRLELEKDSIESIYIPGANRFFDEHGLMYMSIDELDALSIELARAQPFIGRLAEDYSLNGLLSIVGQAIEHKDSTLPVALGPLLNKINQALTATLETRFYQLSWQQLMMGKNTNFIRTQQFILVKPVLDFNAALPAAKPLETIRQHARAVEIDIVDARIRITGEVALEHEELEAASQGAAFSAFLAMVLVCTSLLVGLRSVKLMLATFISLITGLVLTAGFTAISVGHLNLISISFAALYIGLGVDYAIHVCLRYREYLHLPNKEAIISSTQALGPSLILCAVTTSIGFYAFVPTDYVGVSELGIISGTAMFIGLFISLTVLPALLTLMPVAAHQPEPPSRRVSESLYNFPFNRARGIQLLSMLAFCLAASLLHKVSFDSNPINMRAPDSESVSTLRDLLSSDTVSPLTLTALMPNRQQAETLKVQLERLPSVKEVVTILDLVATEQADKLEIIEDLDLVLSTQLDQLNQPVYNADSRGTLKRFHDSVNQGLAIHSGPLQDSLLSLSAQLTQFDQTLDQSTNPSHWTATLETSLIGALPATLHLLQAGLKADFFNISDLPPELARRWLSPEGTYRLEIYPQKNLNNPQYLREFVAEVQTVEASTTGLPISDQASGKAVVSAFQQAFLSALIVIAVLLLIVLKSLKDTLLVLMPLLLVAALTCAMMVLLGSPFNFANIIALPLLLGIGVDSSIHIVARLRSNPEQNPLKTSTSRAIFFANLTTLFSFSSLAFIDHPGVASMGILLTGGIALTLIATLIVLPAFCNTPTPDLTRPS